VLATSALGAAGSEQKQLQAQVATMKQQVADLGAQVRTLQKEVKTLQKQVKSAQSETAANYVGDACLTAMTTDVLQATWLIIDSIATTAQANTYFNAQTALDDKGTCNDISVPRALPTPGVAPTISPFGPFLTWLIGP
jgi:outer membrane protein TolC